MNQRLYVYLPDCTPCIPQPKRQMFQSFFTTIRSLPSIPHLVELKLTHSPFATEDELLELLKKTPHMVDLEVSDHPGLTDRFLIEASQLLKNLEKVNLCSCSFITEKSIAELLQMPRVKNISIAGCTQLDGSVLMGEKLGAPLEYLNLNDLPLSDETMKGIFLQHRKNSIISF